MALRTLLIVAIFAGLASGGVAYYQFSHQIPALVQQREVEKMEKDREVTALNQTTIELKKTASDLNLRQQELAGAKVEQQRALARADVQEKRAETLQGKLAEVNGNLQQNQGALAEYKSSDLTPEQVAKLVDNLRADQKQLALIAVERDKWKDKYVAVADQLEQFEPYEPGYFPPAELRGHVAVVDPKWDFVVLDVGEKQGLLDDCELLVSRQGRLVAKVKVQKTETNRCVAYVMSGWKLGEIIEGDTVTPASYAHQYSYNY